MAVQQPIMIHVHSTDYCLTNRMLNNLESISSYRTLCHNPRETSTGNGVSQGLEKNAELSCRKSEFDYRI